MNKLDSAKRTQVIATLVEGCSVNSTARLTGVSVPTILKLLSDVGDVCADAHDRLVRNVKARRVQADEIWSFVGKKAANATEEEKACGMGDAWVWTAIDADSKLIVSYTTMTATASPTARRKRAVESFQSAAECIGPVRAGMDGIFAITRGQWSMIDAVLHCLDQLAPEPVTLSLWTWTVAEYEIQCLERLMLDKRIRAATLVIDHGARGKNKALLEKWISIFGPGSVRFVVNHSKIATIEGRRRARLRAPWVIPTKTRGSGVFAYRKGGIRLPAAFLSPTLYNDHC